MTSLAVTISTSGPRLSLSCCASPGGIATSLAPVSSRNSTSTPVDAPRHDVVPAAIPFHDHLGSAACADVRDDLGLEAGRKAGPQVERHRRESRKGDHGAERHRQDERSGEPPRSTLFMTRRSYRRRSKLKASAATRFARSVKVIPCRGAQ